MALCPSTVASSGKPQDLYFVLEEDIPAAQVLSQAGNTVSLSGGGGSVNVASTTSVASSAQKLTAVTYNTGLLETNVDGVLNVGLGSAIGSTRVEGGSVVISRSDAAPRIELNESGSGKTSAIFQSGDTMIIDAQTSVMSLTAVSNESSLLLSSDGGGNGSVSLAANNNTTGASSGLTLLPADARITGTGLIQLQSLAGGYMYIDGSGIATAAVAGNLSMTATNDPASRAILRGNADVEITSPFGPVAITANGSASLTSQTLSVDLIAAANINMTAAADISIQAPTSATAQVSIGTSNTVFNMDEATGGITLTAPNSLNLTASIGDLVLTGTNIQSATSSGNSGQHLRIKLNGVFYKIKLEND